MKRIIAVVIASAILLLASCTNSSHSSSGSDLAMNNNGVDIEYQSEYPSDNYELVDGEVVACPVAKQVNPKETTKYSDEKSEQLETRSVWISFLEYEKMLTKKTQEQFTASVVEMYDRLDEYNINSVIIQARAHGDAYYKSNTYPWARRVTGTVDVAPDFDPFEIMVDLANERDYDIHAWINPFRLMEDKDMKVLNSKWAIKKWYDSPNRSDYMINISGVWWLKPSNVECRKLIYKGVREILNNYDVDALHIDDYFYYTSLSKYELTEKQARSYATTTIRGIYKAVKGIDPDIKFGVSPQGGIDANLLPKSDVTQYTDIAKWVTKADYIDYIAPQVYFGFENGTQPFIQTIDRWQQLVDPKHSELIIGLAPYKSGAVDKYAGAGKNEWKNNTDIIARQVEYLNYQSLVDGFVLFRYYHVFDTSLKGSLLKESENLHDVLTK